ILKDYVTVINVGESPDTKVFLAYSAVLRYRFLHLRNEWSNV
ncbi:8530_t:CDS:1, partial [Gigaspora rosea]